MKDYVVWLISRESITGTMEDGGAQRLNNFFKNGSGIETFTDIEGTFTVRCDRIEAIALNKESTKKAIGFQSELTA